MRIAIGGIGHETNTFSTLTTGLAEFYVRRGPECLEGNFWKTYQDQGIEFAPTLTAGARPHGPVERAAYEQLKAELLERLAEALPVDGVYLGLHGAMEVQEIGDGEGDLASAVRAVVGPDVPIVAALDLHGNVSPAFVGAVNVLTALRTAPHRDHALLQERVFGHLLRCIREGLRPVTAMVKLPLILPGEYAVTDVEPARSLYALLPEIERRPGILDASLMIGCAWTDSVYTSVSALVVAEQDIALAQEEATKLARAVWDRRHAFGPDVETASVDEAIERARTAPEPCMFISDAGDNVTAGGAGDSPIFLERLLAANVPDAVVAGLADAEAVRRCVEAGVGARVRLSLGGKLDATNARPLEIEGEIIRLDTSETPTIAVVRTGGVTVLLTDERWPFSMLHPFRRAGIDPLAHKMVVVKLGYLFPELREIAPRAILALSPGFTDLDLARLPYRNLRRPIFPLDPQAEWQV